MTEPAHPPGHLPAWLPMATLTACSPGGAESVQAVRSQPVPVGVVEAKLTPVNLGESFVGRIEAMQKVEVRAHVIGFLRNELIFGSEPIAGHALVVPDEPPCRWVKKRTA